VKKKGGRYTPPKNTPVFTEAYFVGKTRMTPKHYKKYLVNLFHLHELDVPAGESVEFWPLPTREQLRKAIETEMTEDAK
jgi:hypothetical protein